MVLKRYKPTTPGSRHTVLVDDRMVVTSKPTVKSLLVAKTSVSGRRGEGKVCVRHRGGGEKRKYRIIDFKREIRGIPAVVESIEYDPNRTAYIALLCYENGVKSYILSPQGLKVGDKVTAGDKVEPKIGNAMPLSSIPVGTIVHNVELIPGRGGQIARSAGSYAVLQGIDNGYAQLKMPSGEIRLVPERCYATIGSVSNPEHSLEKLGKAGRKRHMGIRPTVRGKAMYAEAHPHGGGEARGVVGGPAKDIWGHLKGKKTRKKRKTSDKLILVRRTGEKVKH